MDATFPATARLKRPSEYVQALKGRRIARGALFVVNTPRSSAESFPQEQARLGLIIPKRVAPLAVTRNQIKRILRDTFRKQRHQLPARDYVFRLHSKVPDISLRQLKELVRNEAEEHLKRVQQ
ncbi:ribonuclease P protein component [Alcaligenaceae bacterium 429]|uniref:ribonuclease P protein component n=1 Tax=Paenalcaligenes sp. Me52 TaxID=3392038 RepID=UPI001091FE69|nr:ribonuclease P protein component [Alcaligenaceae bacterium 429]